MFHVVLTAIYIFLVYEDEEHVGPILVLATKKSGFIPRDEIPPIISKIGSYGSRWRSGMAPKMSMVPRTGKGQKLSHHYHDFAYIC